MTQTETVWAYDDIVANSYAGTVKNGQVDGSELTFGIWQGNLTFLINFEDEYSEAAEPELPHEHSYVSEITKEATCTEPGVETLTCACGDVKTNEIAAKGHSYVSETVEATHTKSGYEKLTCSCGDTKMTVFEALGHSYVSEIVKEATCTEPGQKRFTCSCGDSKVTEIEALGHSFDGYICTRCNYIKTGTPEELAEWNYTLDENNGVVILNHYTGNKTNVTVYRAYNTGENTYKTQIPDSVHTSASMPAPAGSRDTIFSRCNVIRTITFADGLDTSNVTDMSGMFFGCSNLTSINFNGFDTSNVTDMSGMFTNCSNLTSLDLSKFDTSNVTNMEGMFSNCGFASLDLHTFSTSNVTNMNSLFSGCKKLASLNLSSFDTSNVTSMPNMFAGCPGLQSLDLRSFNTSNVTDMSKMFWNDTNLVNIDVSTGKWVMSSKNTNMFYNCGTDHVTYK